MTKTFTELGKLGQEKLETPADLIDWVIESVGARNANEAGPKIAAYLEMTEANAIRSLHRWRKSKRGPGLRYTLALVSAAVAISSARSAEGEGLAAADSELVKARAQTARLGGQTEPVLKTKRSASKS